MDDRQIVVDRTPDEWEQYIRDTNAAKTMLEHGKRWYEYQQDCKNRYGKQGGSRFTEFALERFGMKKAVASIWVSIGANHKELFDIVKHFSFDYRAIYDYIRLDDEEKKLLLDSLNEGETIDRKRIKALTYGHTEGDEWYTPKWLFDALGLQFSIDVCAPDDLTHVTTPADKYYTPTDNGLIRPWQGTIWCNPPYSNPAPWALQCVAHGDGLLLTHIPMNAEWCIHVWNVCSGIRLFQAIEFVRPDGKTQRPGSWLQLAAFGDIAIEALAQMETPNDVAKNPRRVPSPLWVRR